MPLSSGTVPSRDGFDPAEELVVLMDVRFDVASGMVIIDRQNADAIRKIRPE